MEFFFLKLWTELHNRVSSSTIFLKNLKNEILLLVEILTLKNGRKFILCQARKEKISDKRFAFFCWIQLLVWCSSIYQISKAKIICCLSWYTIMYNKKNYTWNRFCLSHSETIIFYPKSQSRNLAYNLWSEREKLNQY